MINELEAITKKLISDLEIRKGMHILDVECGNGDLSFILAESVGINGTVVGLDINENALAFAKERAIKESISNVLFQKIDLNSFALDNKVFDIIIGRRVLMYLKNPKNTVADLSKYLRNDGIMIFQEHDSTKVSESNAAMPLHNKVNTWIWDTVKKEGGNIHIGNDLWNIFSCKNLIIEKITLETVLQTPNKPLSLTNIVKVMQNRIIFTKTATEDEIDITNLDERLKVEREKTNTIYVRENVYCVWARKQE